MFISFAQNFEDVMLWRALKHVKKGFYIDVGAAWPDTHSVTKAFYLDGWRGVNIEPNPELNQLLRTQRPEDINLMVAVGDREDRVLIKIISDTGLSTISESVSKGHAKTGLLLQDTEVQLTTLASIWEQYVPRGRDVHFLKVDVEGFEEAVLRGNDWKNYRAWIIVVEAIMPSSQTASYESWEPILFQANYSFAYGDGLNRFYVANEHSELLDSFKYPPNVFDSFLLSDQQEAEAKAEQAEAASKQTLMLLDAIHNSISWRITTPLRWLASAFRHLLPRPLKPKINVLFQHVARYVVRRPRLKSMAMAILRYTPSFKTRLMRVVRGRAVTPVLSIQKSPLRITALEDSINRRSLTKKRLPHSANEEKNEVELELINAISHWHQGTRIHE